MLTRNDKILAAGGCLFAIFVAIYFFEISSFHLSIDEESAAFRQDASVWVQQGRWGSYLFEAYVLQQPIVPVLPMAIFGLALVAAYILLLDAIGRDRLGAPEYASFAIFCGFPAWFFIVDFYSNVAATGVGLLAAAASLWLFRADRDDILSTRFLAAALMGGFSISIYQSFAPAILTLGLAICVLRARSETSRFDIRDAGRLALLIVAAVVVYKCGDVFFRALFPARNAYFDSLTRPGELLADPINVIGRTISAMAAALGLNTQAYGAPLWSIPLLAALGVFSLVRQLGKRSGFAVLAMLAALAAPFSIHLLSGGYMPMRSLVGMPIAIWFLAYAALTDIGAKTRAMSGWVWAIAVFQIVALQNSYQAANELVGKHDTIVATSIAERLASQPGFDPNKYYALVTFGLRQFPTVYPRRETIGHSFFEWDEPWRIANFSRLLGIGNLTGPTPDQIANHIAVAAALPVWPAEGSVKLVDDVVLVRMGEAASYRNTEALKQSRAATAP